MSALELLQGLAIGAFAFGGAWAAVRLELRVLRRDVDKAHERLDRVDGVLLEHAERLPR